MRRHSKTRNGVMTGRTALQIILTAALLSLPCALGASVPVCKGKVVYSSYETGDAELFLVGDDGTGKTRLTTMPSSNEIWPKFSPDGLSIAFMSCAAPGCSLWVMSVDGTDAHPIRELGGYAYLYDWGESNWVYYAADFDHVGWADDMRRIRPDGSGETVLVSGPTGGASERYDSARVAYVRGQCCWAPGSETRVMDFDGTNDAVIIAADGKSEQWVSYAHTTGEILYHQADGPGGYTFPYNVYSINDDGSGLHQITNAVGGAGFTEPVFSPDDNLIAAMRWLPGVAEPDIVTLNRAGTVLAELAATTAYEQSPDWAMVCQAPPCTYGPTSQPLTFVRGKAKPTSEFVAWESCGGNGVLTIRADHASSAWVFLNGALQVAPNIFNANVEELVFQVRLADGTNWVDVRLEGEPGSRLSLEFDPAD
jgi:TolB protein